MAASPPTSALFAACRFVLARQLTEGVDANSKSMRDGLVRAIVSHGGVVDAELDPLLTTHVIVPAPPSPKPKPGSRNELQELDKQVVTAEEVQARNSRRVHVVYPSFVTACVERGIIVTRELDPDCALVLFDCTRLVQLERERAVHYADRVLFDVDDYTRKFGGTYDPDAHLQAQEQPQAERQPADTTNGGEGQVDDEEEEADFAVSSLARRSNVQVGEVVRVAFLEGSTQQAERRVKWAQQSNAADSDKQAETNGREEVQAEQAEGVEAEEDEQDDEEDEPAEVEEKQQEAAGMGDEELRASVDSLIKAQDATALTGMAACVLPQEDDKLETEEVDDRDPEVQMGEKAFLRIVERITDPANPSVAVSYVAVQLTKLTTVAGSAQYSRIELEPRHIVTVTQLYELEDCKEMHEQNPDKFHLPPLELRSNPTVGSSVKCIFMQESEEGVWRGERMWCTVLKVEQDASGQATGRIRVRMDNRPVLIAGLSMFEELTVEPRHICAIMRC